MGRSLKISALAAVIGASLSGAALLSAPVYAADPSQQAAADRSTYLIEFTEPGALYYDGGVSGLRSTARARGEGGKFNAQAAEVTAYRAHLEQTQSAHVAAIAALIGRSPNVTHHYQFTHSGIAAQLTAAEAADVAGMPGVKSVYADTLENQDTYEGPTFIGATDIWNGVGFVPPPPGPVARGKGVRIAVLDSGANSPHPSFANDASCGFSVADPKLLALSCQTTDGGGVCNGPSPEADAISSGHGVHTASTAGGNVVTNAATPSPNLPAPYTQLSGVAPCAWINSYKVCNEPTGQCATAHSIAGVNNAILTSSDVINFSISGGTNPWTDNDRNFLDAVNAGIVVSASAGNTSATVTNPVGQVNHRGPWVMTVAASQHDRELGAGLSATGPGTPPADTQNLIAAKGSTTPANVPFSNQPLRHNAANPFGCTATGGHPAGFFTGAVAVISRGTCSFTEKITNATTAGAVQVIIYNNTFGTISMDTTGAPATPAYSIRQAGGVALVNFIAANGATPTTGTLVNSSVGNITGDVLANFSLRGPTPGVLVDETKPDITGPGVGIYAAKTTAEGEYGLLSGTSMSSPHLAGSAALLRAVRPSWTPMEVKSALQMTAKVAGMKENETVSWDADDVGSGRVDMTKAGLAGLVMDETFANFLAANPSGGSISVRDLNIPSVRNMACTPSCTFTRIVKSSLTAPATWNVTTVAPPGFTMTATPTTFVLAPGLTQTMTITITPSYGLPATVVRFGQVNFATTIAGQSPDEHITAAVKGTVEGIFKHGFE